MTGRTGTLSAACSVVSAGSPAVVRVDLDTRRHRFLRDHLVDSRPLLSTVMGIETMACAAALIHPDRVIASIVDLRIGAPFFLPASGDGHVDVTVAQGSTLLCEVRDAAGTVHFSARLTTELSPTQVPTWPAAARSGGVDSATIYALFFHGESFRVLASAHYTPECMVGRFAADLPAIAMPGSSSMMAPLLIELCLQTAGLWELAASGRMAIPDGIQRVTRFTNLDSSSPARFTALVTPRPGVAECNVFDAVVIDETGAVQLTVQGYRTTPFGDPYDQSAAADIRRTLLDAR